MFSHPLLAEYSSKRTITTETKKQISQVMYLIMFISDRCKQDFAGPQPSAVVAVVLTAEARSTVLSSIVINTIQLIWNKKIYSVR